MLIIKGDYYFLVLVFISSIATKAIISFVFFLITSVSRVSWTIFFTLYLLIPQPEITHQPAISLSFLHGLDAYSLPE